VAFPSTSPNTQAGFMITSSLNASLQVGDLIYCNCQASTSANYAVSTVDPLVLGEVTEMAPDDVSQNWNWIGIQYTGIFTGINITAPISGCTTDNLFLTFAKNNSVNKSSLKGYFNLVNFQNNSKTKAELFSVNSEVTLSIK
jgi:hypothetical protein